MMKLSPQKATFLFALFAVGLILCVGGLLFTFGLLAPDQFYNASLFAVAVVVITLPVFYFVSYSYERLFDRQRQQLRVEQLRIREYAEIATDWLWETDADLKVIPVSEPMLDAAHTPFELPSAISLGDIINDLVENKERRREFADNIKSRQAFKGIKYKCEPEKDKPLVFALSGKPLFDESGRFIGYRGIGTNITRQMTADYLVRNETGKLLQLMDRSAHGIMVIRQGKIEYANASARKVLGYDRKSIQDMDLQEIFYTRLPSVEDVALALEQSDQLVTPISLKLRSKDGSDIYLHAVFQQNNWDIPAGLTLTFFDATARKLDENSLRRQRRFQTVGRLTGGVAHDFNNFLAIILGNLELMDETLRTNCVLDNDELQTRIGKSIEAAERGANLVEQLVSYSQKQMLEPVELELDRFLGEISILLKSILGSGIGFEMKSGAAGQAVFVDPSRLEDALINILLVLAEGPRRVDGISLQTKMTILAEDDSLGSHDKVEPGRYVVLCIDQGVKGIDDEFLAKAEDPFVTDQEVSDQDVLAVSAVTGFIKQSGGYYSVEKQPGGENLICFYFPALRSSLSK